MHFIQGIYEGMCLHKNLQTTVRCNFICGSQLYFECKTTFTSINSWMDKCYTIIQWGTPQNKNKLLLHAPTLMSLRIIMLKIVTETRLKESIIRNSVCLRYKLLFSNRKIHGFLRTQGRRRESRRETHSAFWKAGTCPFGLWLWRC